MDTILKRNIGPIFVLVCTVVWTVNADETSRVMNWPSFRGPGASGVSEGSTLPTKFDIETGKNILWRIPIPGLGHSCPVIWGDRIFLTTAVREAGDQSLKVGLYGDIQPVNDDSKFRWVGMCLDKKSGKVLWEKTACEGTPKVKRHTKASHANSTPATDGKHVVAMFGSEGLYCYDADGKLLWNKDLGLLDSGFYMVPDAQWGFGSSPVIFDNKVILQCDVQKNSFLAAFDVRDGKELWMTLRDEVPTWSTPAIVKGPDGVQVVVNGYKRIAGYDVNTGKEIWNMQGGGDIPVPTPVVAHDLIYITNAHGMGAPIYAIRPTAKGEITLSGLKSTNKHVAWSQARQGNYMQTPLVLGDLIYFCMDNGVVTCYDAKSGKKKYRKRLASGTGFTASPVANADHIFFTSEEGDVYVIKAGPEWNPVSKSSLGESFMSTPAISEDAIYFRTQGHLVAVGDSSVKQVTGS